MKNYLKKTFVALLFFVAINCVDIHVNAAPNNPQDTYTQGVNAGAIDKYTVSFAQWETQNSQYYQIYQQGLNHGMYQMSYEQWLKENNFGQGPISSGKITKKENNKNLRALNDMTVKPGDIIVTNSASSGGILGHAAICDRPGYVLDMPGSPAEPLNDNNRELTAQEWFNHYHRTGKFIKVYHAQNQKDAQEAALVGDYALSHYWDPNRSFTKSIHIPYSIFYGLYNTSAMYCSKLVYDAYWFTTGNDSLIKESKVFETPYELAADIKFPLTEVDYTD